ncbi:MAG: VOC family protein [Verrucomicrobiota bacterium]
MNTTPKTDALNWFEIYVNDFERAKRFYEQSLHVSLQVHNMDQCQMGMFPFDMQNGIGGALTKMPGMSPGPGGTMVYLNVEGDLDGVIQRIPAAGGKIVKPRTSIGEHGYIGIFTDTEGNTVGLHSMK